jgi:hypothetical protein
MVDPVSAAVSAATKAAVTAAGKSVAAKGGTRLGSRNERRAVYTRFQAATVEALSFAQYLRMENKIAPLVSVTTRVQRELAAKTHAAQTELMQAYMEFLLVSNPGPAEAGEAMLSGVSDLLGLSTKNEVAFDAQLKVATKAQLAFVEACRQDLWYLPQRWQFYRPSWWRAAWSRWRWKHGAVEGRAASPEELQAGER